MEIGRLFCYTDIEALLDRYAEQYYVVTDPFSCSGTVLYVCAQKGIAATGNGLNPPAYYMDLRHKGKYEKKC